MCGKTFSEGAEKDRDHVPPKSIFATEDRDLPLILPTHSCCNRAQSDYDEIVGQLVAAIHGKYPKPANMKLDVQVAESAEQEHRPLGSAALISTGSSAGGRAFHAALYREVLPDNDGTTDGTMFGFDPPFPVGHVDKDGEISVDAIRPHHTYFVKQVKRNRTAGRLDRIVCFNGKCVYECVWDKADGGQPICIFALNLYDWSSLANTEDFPKRGCVGTYLPVKGRPLDATTATSIAIPISNVEKLDPFGQGERSVRLCDCCV